MKLAILSESPADEAAIWILVNAILPRPADPISLPRLRTRGWPSVLHVLPGILAHLHYHTDTDALALVVDSDNSPLHDSSHEQGTTDARCRLCMLQQAVLRQQQRLSTQHRALIKVAIGLAVPAIEGWYRCGHDPHATEIAFTRQIETQSHVVIKNRLKQEVYGTDRPSLELAKAKATEEATRLAKMLDSLERNFPIGFGSLLRVCRGW